MFPTILLDTEGSEISKISLVIPLVGVKSHLKFIFLGIKNKNTMIEDISDTIVSKTRPITAFITDCSISLGRIKIIIINLTICSIMLLVACGTIFCLPEKYPFKTLEIDTKGSVKAMAISIGPDFGSLSKFVAIKSWVKNIIIIRIKLIKSMRDAADVSILILLPLFSATNFDIDIGIARVAMVRSREYVGVAIVYKLIP